MFIVLLFGATIFVTAQNQPTVCLPQETANKLLKTVDDLIAAKDAIAKLTAERANSDAVIQAANRVIEDYKQLDAVHAMQIATYKDIVALYEKTLTMYADLVEKMEKKLNAPRSAWQKFASAIKEIGILLAGISLGRAF